MWLGYFEEFPDYLTQGESLAERAERESRARIAFDGP